MVFAGSMGVGAVWGWLLALLGRPSVHSPWRHYPLTLLYTAALALLIFYLSSALATLLFFLTLFISFSIHRAWQRS